MPRFSIVVPVYNVAPYLREFLDSVLAQTESDWEAICVDDGSTDESGKILDEYANKDSRFGIVHQENGGVSVARNAGLERVRGEWFFIVDPDDILGSDYIHELYGLVKDVGGGGNYRCHRLENLCRWRASRQVGDMPTIYRRWRVSA